MATHNSNSLARIPLVLPILSGKGGVGKSSVTVQLALSLCHAGSNVGILDIDLTGPSIPRLLGVEGAKVRQAPGGWLPVTVHDVVDSKVISKETGLGESLDQPAITSGVSKKVGALYSMSLGYLLSSRGDAVIWRGPKKTAMVKQLLSDVLWPLDVDILLIDTPPGTSDEHISLVTQLQSIAPPGQAVGATEPNHTRIEAIIVTTPQAIATSDVRKELSFCSKVGLRVQGIIENMAGYVCPCCGEITNLFSKGGGQVMAQDWHIKFLGSIPIDSGGWGMCVEEGKWPVYENAEGLQRFESQLDLDTKKCKHDKRDPSAPLVERYTACALYPAFKQIAQHIRTRHGDYVQLPHAS